MRAYSFEMSLLLFLYDEVVPVIRVLVLTRGPNAIARNKDSWPYSIHILWQYALNNSKSFVDENSCINLPMTIMHVLFWRIHERVAWEKDWVHFSVDRKWAIYNYPVRMPSGRAFTSQPVGREFEPRSSHTKDLKNGTHCLLVWRSTYENGVGKLNSRSYQWTSPPL